jgi:DNA transposition AAA+ family ATPase
VKKVPVLYTKVPVRATPKSLASKILLDLGDPMFDRGSEITLTNRLLTCIGKDMCEVEMIIIDEFQHLIDRETTKVLRRASDWLKSFSEDAGIPIIICGMPESENIFKSNEQLDGRFGFRVEMKSLDFDTKEDVELFRNFLYNLDNSMPFHNRSNLADRLLAEKIYYASTGNHRYLKKILVLATESSLKSGKDSIDEIDLHLAYERYKTSARKFAVNPFMMDKFDWKTELEKEFRKNNKKKSG